MMNLDLEKLKLYTCGNFVFDRADSVAYTYSLHVLLASIAAKYLNGTDPSEIQSIIDNICKVRVREPHNFTKSYSVADDYSYFVECASNFAEEISLGDGWKSLDTNDFPLNQYLSQIIKTKAYRNDEIHSVVVFVEKRISERWLQAYESTISKTYPWLFGNGITEEDRLFFKKIAVDNAVVTDEEKASLFVDFLNDIYDKCDYRTYYLHKYLDGIQNRVRNRLLSSKRNDLENQMIRVRDYLDTLQTTYHSIDTLKEEIRCIENQENSNENAFFDFFNSHKNINIIRCNDHIKYSVVDTLEYYDNDEFESIINRKTSWIYDFPEDIVKTITEIFSKKRGIIHVSAVFELREMRLVRPKKENAPNAGNSMPNPHIYYYACSGGNDIYYSQYAESGDWDLAIEQSISATKNLSWGDSTVCSKMIRWLIENDSEKCIYINDDYSPLDSVDPNKHKLVSFKEFKDYVTKTESEEANNG